MFSSPSLKWIPDTPLVHFIIYGRHCVRIITSFENDTYKHFGFLAFIYQFSAWRNKRVSIRYNAFVRRIKIREKKFSYYATAIIRFALEVDLEWAYQLLQNISSLVFQVLRLIQYYIITYNVFGNNVFFFFNGNHCTVCLTLEKW